jgi:hypothetical protein
MPYPYYQYPNFNQMYYQQQTQNIQQQTPQIQNGGFVFVKDINEARNYAVAPGNSVTFKIESQPYICTKTLGFSQLDQPIFEVFKLVKEDNEWQSENKPLELAEEVPVIEYLPLEDADKMRVEMQQMKSEIEFLRETIDLYTKEEKGEK